ncbi:unnamed protein product, partial [Heterotrigona itama]
SERWRCSMLHVTRRRNGQKEAITGCSILYNLVIPTDIVR